MEGSGSGIRGVLSLMGMESACEWRLRLAGAQFQGKLRKTGMEEEKETGSLPGSQEESGMEIVENPNG